jgi:hypothetical protein
VAESKGNSFCKRRRVNTCCREKKKFVCRRRTIQYDSGHLYSAGRKIKCITAVIKFSYPEYTEGKGVCSIYNIEICRINKCLLLHRINSYRCLSPAFEEVPRSVPQSALLALSRAPACQPWNAHRYLPAKREEYSASPFAPRAAKGPHKNQKIASVSARLNG